jgi:hypothetical protein
MSFKQFLEFTLHSYSQGALDSLCGVYSVVNSVDAVLNTSQYDAYTAFKVAIKSIGYEFPAAAYEGTTIDDVDAMLKAITRWVHRNYNKTVSYTAPFGYNQFKDSDTFLQALSEQLDDKSVAIVGIESPFAHWTVVQKMVDNTIKFFDSDGLTLVDKAKVDVIKHKGKWIMTPGDTRIIRNIT